MSEHAPTRPDDETVTDAEWRSVGERGSVFAIKALVVFATMFGRGVGRAIVAFVAFYYTLFSGQARRAVRDVRTRLGLRTRFRDSYRHIRRFAQCALDALFFLRGAGDKFRITRNGHEHLAHLRDSGTSAILIGAHLGSFYAMRGQSSNESLPLHPVVYTKNARRFNDVLEALDPTSTVRLIEIGDGGDMQFMLKIRERVEEGALVAILADRLRPGGPSVTVDFLGGKVRLPSGPYVLASMLRCPVYFTAGIYRGGNHYELYCIPFADRIVLPRGKREEGIQRYAQQYADQLAELLKGAPENWFNFFRFWEDEPTTEATQ